MIENREYRIKRSQVGNIRSLHNTITELIGPNALRWYVSEITRAELVIEATICNDNLRVFDQSVDETYYPGKSVVVNIIPTGVGCEIGGYAGDAAPATNLLAAAADYLVTNPNAVNASNFISLERNVVYTEGFCIDLFCKGLIDLYIPYANRVGLIIEEADERQLDVVFNIVNTVKAVYGINIVDYVITKQPIGSRCVRNKSGAYVGSIDRPEVILDACAALVDKGANAIAITSNVQDLPREEYALHFAGQDANPTGGVEAVISHLITNQFRVPAAHAPMINVKDIDFRDQVVDARAAGEMASESGLACVLIGLHRAAQITRARRAQIADAVNVNNLLAVVAPAGCMGGIPTIYAQLRGVPVIAVDENRTLLGITPSMMGFDNVIEARSYAEAAGIVMALKRGINLESISRPLTTMKYEVADRELVTSVA